MRLAAAFDWNGVLAPANIRVDAWVTPPLYTGKPADHPVGREQGRRGACSGAACRFRRARTLIVRSSGGTLDVVVGGGVTEAVAVEQAPKGTNERQFTIAGDGTAHVRSPSGQPQWKFSATPDRAPTIALAKDPERQARGSLQMSYKIEDDYGVTEAQARSRPAPGESSQGRRAAAAAVRRAAVCAGAAERPDPQRRRPDREGSQRRSLCRRRRHADADGEGRGRQ